MEPVRIPVEKAEVMDYARGGPNALSADPPIWNEFRQILHDTATDLELKLSAFKDYYNGYRVHAALKGQTPIETTKSKAADLKFYRWQKHCRGIYQTPIAA